MIFLIIRRVYDKRNIYTIAFTRLYWSINTIPKESTELIVFIHTLGFIKNKIPNENKLNYLCEINIKRRINGIL